MCFSIREGDLFCDSHIEDRNSIGKVDELSEQSLHGVRRGEMGVTLEPCRY